MKGFFAFLNKDACFIDDCGWCSKVRTQVLEICVRMHVLWMIVDGVLLEICVRMHVLWMIMDGVLLEICVRSPKVLDGSRLQLQGVLHLEMNRYNFYPLMTIFLSPWRH